MLGAESYTAIKVALDGYSKNILRYLKISYTQSSINLIILKIIPALDNMTNEILKHISFFKIY